MLGGVGLLYIRKVIVAWNEWRTSVFGMEREASQRRLGTALSVLALAALLALSEFVLISFVSPALPATSLLPTPTLDLLATATPTLPSEAVAEGAAQATLVPNMANLPLTEGCQAGRIEWIEPLEGAEVLSGSVTLKFIVNLDNLGFYKYEYGQPGSDVWTTIAAGNQSSETEQTATWNTDQLVPGDYFLRLVVMDGQNNPQPVCVTSVRIVLP